MFMQSLMLMPIKRSSRILIPCLCVALQFACGGKAVYTGESFATDSPFKMKVDSEVAMACESARRSLLGQGYLIDVASIDTVKGHKAIKNAADRSTFIEMNVVCVPERQGSALYANGVLSTYDLKKSSSAASVGVAAVGSISLPIGQSADSLVKIAEETIDDKNFYSRFFAAVAHTLDEIRPHDPEPVPAQIEPSPAPGEAPVPTSGSGDANHPLEVPEAVPGEGTPVSAPEPGPVQDVTEIAPVPMPVQGGAELAPAPFPAQDIPGMTPEPAPVQAVPITAPEAPALPESGAAGAEPATEPVPGPIPAEESPAPARVPYFGM